MQMPHTLVPNLNSGLCCCETTVLTTTPPCWISVQMVYPENREKSVCYFDITNVYENIINHPLYLKFGLKNYSICKFSGLC